MKFAWIVLILVVSGGCAVREDVSNDVKPFDYVRWVHQPNGKIFAEAYISALDENSRLEGNTKQDVVALIHKDGKVALPDSVDLDEQEVDPNNPSGVVPISIYHLLNKSGDTEIGYYKRRFARSK